MLGFLRPVCGAAPAQHSSWLIIAGAYGSPGAFLLLPGFAMQRWKPITRRPFHVTQLLSQPCGGPMWDLTTLERDLALCQVWMDDGASTSVARTVQWGTGIPTSHRTPTSAPPFAWWGLGGYWPQAKKCAKQAYVNLSSSSENVCFACVRLQRPDSVYAWVWAAESPAHFPSVHGFDLIPPTK